MDCQKDKERRGLDSQRDRAIETLDDVEYWLSRSGDAYATVKVKRHFENHRVRSRAFRRIVQIRASQSEGRHVPKAVIDEVLASAEAQAVLSEKVYDVHLRAARTRTASTSI